MVFLTLLAVFTLTACDSVPGTCDDGVARRVVRTTEGIPAYEGQALVIASCGGGNFCHSEGIEAEERHGAPAGLDFHIGLASTGPEAGDVDRLARARTNIFLNRGNAWGQVSSGAMPPSGEGERVVADGPAYFRDSGEPLPAIDTDEGREIFRGWLACGTPVVERTEARADGEGNTVGDTLEESCRTDADCTATALPECGASNVCGGCTSDAVCSGTDTCDSASGACVAPVATTWSAIYAEIIEPRCASAACHGGRSGSLVMTSADGAYANLVGVAAAGNRCRGSGTRVVAGDPAASLLVSKLGPDPVCGEAMPLGRDALPTQWIDSIRAWIMAGAAND